MKDQLKETDYVQGPPWSCWLYLTIQCWDGEATVSRHVFLPFVPQPGLSLVFSEEKCDYADLAYVEWVVAEGVFWVWCEPHSYCQENHPSDRCWPLKGMIEGFLKNGWELWSETLIDDEDEKFIKKDRPNWKKLRKKMERACDLNCRPREAKGKIREEKTQIV
jgi:hypothetical protein